MSIVGFPFGLTGGGALGVWVRGWIATEPTTDYNDLLAFLVDSRTRQGQSGSPVIIYESGGAVAMADGGTAIFGGPVEQFLGVYSGRISERSDLGFVGKASVIRDIVDGGRRRFDLARRKIARAYGKRVAGLSRGRPLTGTGAGTSLGARRRLEQTVIFLASHAPSVDG